MEAFHTSPTDLGKKQYIHDNMKEYNKEKPSKYIMYLDANNLYGYAMSQYLPTGGFKWLTEKQIDKIMNKTMLPDHKKGEYPEKLHELHNDYPLAAEN